SAMAVRVRVPPALSPKPLPAQLLPCRVQHDGPAPVAAFLRVRPGPGGGCGQSSPQPLSGTELPKSPSVGQRAPFSPPLGGLSPPFPLTFALCRQAGWVTVTGTFAAITDWGADAAPHPDRGLARALQWGPLAQAV
ncbi:RNH2C Ribonuclease, partial [Grantiella picta]|nr:RNH2C Ribonuclease [Grantiella picta]